MRLCDLRAGVEHIFVVNNHGCPDQSSAVLSSKTLLSVDASFVECG